MSWLGAGFAAVKGALDAWNHERGKTQTKETVQLGMDIARAKDDKAAATAAKTFFMKLSPFLPSTRGSRRISARGGSLPPEDTLGDGDI